MKKIIDFLRKMGLLHVSSGDYTTGEFDAKNNSPKTPEGTKDKEKKSGFGLFFFGLFSIVGIVVLLFTLIMVGFSLWFFLFFVVWLWFIFHTKKSVSRGIFSAKKFFVIFFVIIFINVIIVLFSGTAGTTSDTASTTGTATAEVSSSDVADDNSICAAKHLDKKANGAIRLKIVDDNYNDKTTNVYTMDELSQLSMMAEVTVPDDGIYLSTQMCRNDEPVTFAPLSKMYFLSKEKVHADKQMHYAPLDQVLHMIHPGHYQVYSYYSHDGKTWYIDKEIDFDVK